MISKDQSAEMQQEQNFLKIQLYTGLLKKGFYLLKFPAVIEHEYILHRNTTYGHSNRTVLIIGLIFYMMFGISDFWLAEQHGAMAETLKLELLIPRTILAVGFSLALIATAFLNLDRWLYHIISLGFIAISFSIIYFIHKLQAPYKFLYYLGFLPVQMYAIIALRQSFRSVVVISAFMFSGFTLYLQMFDNTTDIPVLSNMLDIILTPYLIYWAIMIFMACYIVYTAEYAVRKEYLQGQVVKFEGENMSLLKDQMQQLAITDPLTQLYNRRYFEQVLEREWRTAIRHQDVVSLMLIDVDYFKAYNDFYGHQAGDKCLQIIAKTIRQNAQRAEDLAVRYGGEEFILLFPKLEEGDACKLADNIRENIARLGLPHEESDFGIITISLGVVTAVPKQGESPEALIRQADQLLYRSKQQGRNKALCLDCTTE